MFGIRLDSSLCGGFIFFIFYYCFFFYAGAVSLKTVGTVSQLTDVGSECDFTWRFYTDQKLVHVQPASCKTGSLRLIQKIVC